MFVLNTLLNSFRSVLVKFCHEFRKFSVLYFRCLIFQVIGLIKLSLIALAFRLTAIGGLVAAGFGAVWVFGHLGRFFSFDIWSFREFSHLKVCSRQFCSVFGKFIHSFSSLFEISAKFCYFYYATSWFSPRNLIY